jgi:hypothetical protein
LGNTAVGNKTETLIDASKEVGLEINVCLVTRMQVKSIHKNGKQILRKCVAVQIFKNCIQEKIKRRLNSGNAFYHSVQKLLSSQLLSKNEKIIMYTIIILPVVLYGCETWFLILREE